MVYLSTEVLEKSQHYGGDYPTPKAPSKLSNREIKDYLIENKIPRTVASPWPRLERGLEFISGETGNLIGDKRDSYVYNKYRTDEYVEIDTYFNKVLEQACKRGIVQLYLKGGVGEIMLWSDIIGLKIEKAWEDDWPELKRILDSIKASEESAKESKIEFEGMLQA